MKLLLDTNVFLWSAISPAMLSGAARAALLDDENDLLLSVVSPWETAVKMNRARLDLPWSLADLLEDQVRSLNLAILPVLVEHSLAMVGLPRIHDDPFDRMLIAQAIVEGAAIVTSDRVFERYPVEVTW